MKRFLKTYIKNTEGAGIVEFVIIALVFLSFVFFVIEMTLAFFFIQSAQKAAHIGARIAIVSDPVVAGLPVSNGLVDGQIFGTSCSDPAGPCTGFTRLTCTGIACENTDAFNRILGRMQNFLGGLEAEHVTFSYSYEGLGYAGGPVIPAVTVRIEGVPHQTGVLGSIIGGPWAGTLPAVSVTLTGEDLSESGA